MSVRVVKVKGQTYVYCLNEEYIISGKLLVSIRHINKYSIGDNFFFRYYDSYSEYRNGITCDVSFYS